MAKVSFVAGGGADYIGGSFYVLRIGDKYLGIDCGANLGDWDSITPNFEAVPLLHYLLLSHGHFDHVGMFPALLKKHPGLKTFSSIETKELARLLWQQTIRKAREDEFPLPFEEQDAEVAYHSIANFPYNKELHLADDIIVYPIPSGHILGSNSFLICVDDEYYFFTSDICFQDRSLISGALRLGLEKCRLLIRESTYVTEDFIESREEVIARLLRETNKVIDRGGKVLTAALSIDRAQDIFSILAEVFRDEGLLLFLDGSRKAFGIYQRHLPGAEILDKAVWFRSKWERRAILEKRAPAVIIASSGMMYQGTPSAFWAENLVYDERNAIFLVNYQDPTGQGYVLANAKKGQSILLNRSLVRVKCDVIQFNFSAHMDGRDGEELEERTNPETIIYIHGERSKIDNYISAHRDARRRIRAEVGKEVEV